MIRRTNLLGAACACSITSALLVGCADADDGADTTAAAGGTAVAPTTTVEPAATVTPDVTTPAAGGSTAVDPAAGGTGGDERPMLDPIVPPMEMIPVAETLDCPEWTGEITTDMGWVDGATEAAATTTLTFELQARPAVVDQNGVIGIGDGVLAAFPDTAASVRFASDGTIDVRSGENYVSDMPVYPYAAGNWYTFTVTVDVAARTYDVQVANCLGESQMLMTGAVFRTDTTVTTQLTTWGIWTDKPTLEVAGAVWTSGG